MTRRDRLAELRARILRDYGDWLDTGQVAAAVGISVSDMSRKLCAGFYPLPRFRRGRNKCATSQSVAELLFYIESWECE